MGAVVRPLQENEACLGQAYGGIRRLPLRSRCRCYCTAAGKPLCDSNGVKGFPTIKYGSPSDLQDYQGGRDFDALLEFASENLGPTCSPDNLELCSDEKKAEIAKFTEMGADALQEKVTALDKQIADADETFNTELKKLQESYEKLQKDKEDSIAEAKGQGLGMMKSVLASLKSGGDDKDEL